jgi:hypothetical protein
MCEQTGPAIPALQGFYTKMCRFSVLHLTYSTCTMIDACCDMSRSDCQMSRPMISIMCVSTYVCLSAMYIPVHLEGMHVVCMSSCIQASCLDEWPPIEEPERCEQGPHRKGPARNPKLTAVSTKSRTLQSLWNSIPGVPSVLCGTVRTSVATKAAPAEDSLRRCGRCGTAGCFSTMHLHVSCSQASIILPILFSCPFAAHTPEHHGADNKKTKLRKTDTASPAAKSDNDNGIQ